MSISSWGLRSGIFLPMNTGTKAGYPARPNKDGAAPEGQEQFASNSGRTY